MATIIEFPSAEELSQIRGDKIEALIAHTQSAEIIIFPGVKVLRDVEGKSAASVPTSANNGV